MSDPNTLTIQRPFRLTAEQGEWLERQAQALRERERFRATPSDVVRRLIDEAMTREVKEGDDADA